MAAVASGGVQRETSRIPDETVFYSLYPDSSLSKASSSSAFLDEEISVLHQQILDSVAPFVSDYVWQHEPFHLSVSSDPVTHFHGKTRFGDNLEDEWFVVFLLFHVSRAFPSLSIQVFDSDGQFLLIEAAFSLPRWLNPETTENRVFIRNGALHIIPKKQFPSNPSLLEALKILSCGGYDTGASDSIQAAISRRIADYPERARKNMHRVTVQVPVSVAWVLKHEPCLISLAVEGFYDRDVDSMKFAAKMEKFLEKGKEEGMVRVSVRMSRAMYAQLVQQKFQAPKCYPMPRRADDRKGFLEAELGMKIACGFEMMYQMRKRAGSEGKGSTWEVFKKSLENSGYFKGLLPGSKEYRKLMENAEQYYRKSATFSRTSELMSAPVRRIDEILSLPHSMNDFRDIEIPPSDDDAWLYDGESELNSALEERQKEMDLYESQRTTKQKSREQSDSRPSSRQVDEFNFGDIAKSMEAFVKKVSSFEGAEVPENRDSKEVDFDVEHFLKEMESVVGHMGQEVGASHVDSNEGNSSASDMDFDDSDDESNIEDGNMEDSFMDSYSNALNEQLKPTTLQKSFIRANGEPSASASKEQVTPAATEDMEEDFSPVDVDVNLVKSLLDSFSSQQGLPGPASNLLGLMGLQLPEDSNKGK
ncbi:hypothetical protein H6P81_020858 [Aristolochia fimbriata]|uniref:Protein ecdysoneless homolog n=1 Tax=Aristolochia fimbriata TaxID=158543 RepID=A0AAV7DVR2_ARIFI|nr:hypothetical protein H6P81_020858 [Aristolochia fimbriata]